MVWTRLSFEFNSEALEAVRALLLERGFTSLEYEEDPSGRTVVKIYLQEGAFPSSFPDLLKEEFTGLKKTGINPGEIRVKYDKIREEDWATAWKKFFHCQKVGERVIVCPPWKEYDPAGDDNLTVRIDPGMAFGTGSHPTTILMIRALEKYGKQGMSLLDIGCGSGILSITAALLGFEPVKGIDIDPNAVEAARSNALLNGVADKIEFRLGNFVRGESAKYELVVANLLPHLILELNLDVARVVTPGGLYLVSGINLENKNKVARDLENKGFKIIEEQELDTWVGFVTRRS